MLFFQKKNLPEILASLFIYNDIRLNNSFFFFLAIRAGTEMGAEHDKTKVIFLNSLLYPKKNTEVHVAALYHKLFFAVRSSLLLSTVAL